MPKIVQSLWTEPLRLKADLRAGWPSEFYHFAGWVLSSLQLKNVYGEVHLYTDDLGAFLLIDKLGLPYDSVSLELNNISRPPSLWALGKIMTYRMQTEPFIHVDGDVFIWEQLNERMHQAGLVAQNLDLDISHYKKIYSDVIDSGFKLPSFMESSLPQNIYGANAGILGGNDLDFIESYTSFILDFLDVNSDKIKDVNNSLLCLFCEQSFFYYLAKEEKCPIDFLFAEIDNGYQSYVDFWSIDLNKNYIHLVSTHKQNEYLLEQMVDVLRVKHLKYYYRLLEFYKWYKSTPEPYLAK